MPWDLLDKWRDEDGWPPPEIVEAAARPTRMTRAQQQLVLDHQQLVRGIVGQMLQRRQIAGEYEELVGDGNEGLCRAALRFEQGRASFVSFAWRWIVGSVYDGARRREWRTRSAMQAGEQRPMFSLDDTSNVDGGGDMHSIIGARQPDAAELLDARDDLRALGHLSPRLKELLVRHYFYDESPTQLATELGVSRSRISQLLEDARRELRVLRRAA